MPDLEKRKRELIEKRDELIARFNAINMDFRQGLDRDLEECSLQLQNDEVLLEIARITTEELNKIDAALTRIETAINVEK